MNQNATMARISQQTLLKYIEKGDGNEADRYYQQAAKKLLTGERHFYWNWPATFFSSYWLAYRRMYLEAALFQLFFLYTDVLSHILVINYTFLALIPFPQILLIIGLGLFGTRYYFSTIKVKILKGLKPAERPIDKFIVHLMIWPQLILSSLIGIFSFREILENIGNPNFNINSNQFLMYSNYAWAAFTIVFLLYKYFKAKSNDQ